MKKFLTLISFFLCLSFSQAQAQQTEKTVVYIDYFSRPSNVSATLAEALRNKVLEGINTTNRVHLIDVSTQSQLNSEEERRKAESAMGDITARTSQMKTLGANYIIVGDIVSMEAPRRVDEKTNAVSYKGSVSWSIKVIDASTGTIAKSQAYNHEGFTGVSRDTPDEAIVATADYARINMRDLVEELFPLEGSVLKVETATKKGDRAQTVIIDLGSTQGLSKGQRFSVYHETDIAGEIARKEIGSLNVKEVLSPGRSICSVGSKGGDLILKALNADQKVIIVSRKPGLLEF